MARNFRTRRWAHLGSGKPAVERLEDRTVPSVYDGSFQAIHLTDLRNDPNLNGLNGHGIGIADLDSGIYAQNPDIQPNLAAWFDAVTLAEGGNGNTQPFDPHGHGTHTAGIEAASDPNIGVAPGATLVAVRAVATPGYDNLQTLQYQDTPAIALQWVLDNYRQYNILVVNMSFGDPRSHINQQEPITPGVPELIAQLEAVGVTVVASSGNNYAQWADGTSNELGVSNPSNFATLSVANTWGNVGNQSIPPQPEGNPPADWVALETAGITDTLSASSERSTLPNQIAAPGSGIYVDGNGNQNIGILSTWNQPDKLFNVEAGTSMAAPMVSGVVALMQQAAIAYGGRPLPPAQIRAILQNTADTITDSNNPTNARVPIVNGRIDANSQDWTDLPETGLTFQRINAYHAVQEVIREVTTPSVSGGSDTDSTIATANVLPAFDGTRPAVSVTGNVGSDGRVQVGPNDVDLYKLQVASPGNIAITLGPVSGGTNVATYLRLFDRNGNELANDTTSAGNGYSALRGRIAAGTYYVGVSGFGNTTYNVADGSNATGGQSTGDFTMTVELDNPDPNGVITGAVPFAGLPNVFHGSIGSDPDPNHPGQRIQIGPGDVDMFAIVAPDTGNLIVQTNTAAYGSQAVNTYLRVFDARGNQLAFNDNANGSTTDSALSVAVARGQQVFVAVSDAQNPSYNPFDPFSRSTAGTGGLYDLFMDFDNGDKNGTIYKANAFNIGDTVQGSVGHDFGNLVGANGSKDVDFEKYTPAQDGVLNVQVARQTQGFTPTLSLWTFTPRNPTDPNSFDSATKLADTASTGSPEVDYQVQAGHDYYVAVTGLGNADFRWYATASGTGGETGNYTLTTSLQPVTQVAALSQSSFSAGGVRTIALGQSISATLGMDGNLVVGPTDVHLYRFVAPATQTVDAHTITTAEGSADTFLRFFDAQGNELAYNDNANPNTTASEVRVPVQAGQTYYIGIDGAIGKDGTDHHARDYNPLTGTGAAVSTSLGNYTLVLTAVPAPAPRTQPPVTSIGGDVTNLVRITFGRPHFNARRHRQTIQVTLTNLSASQIQGAIWVVVVNLKRKTKLRNATGFTANQTALHKPVVMVPVAGLASGASVSVTLDVSGLTARRAAFGLRVFAGQAP